VKLSDGYKERYSAFLERFRQARTESGLSQEEVADRLGVSQSLISRAESGDRRIDIIELQAFAELYRKSLVFFLSND
jgi:transcriptional regulator with XRE-family HTH domain